MSRARPRRSRPRFPAGVESALRLLAACLLVAPLVPVVRAAEGSAPAYRAVAVRGPGSVAALRARLGPRVFDEVLRLNRVDAEHVSALDSLVLPDPAPGFTAPSPFPERAGALGRFPKLVLVSISVQAFAAYDSGRLVHWGPVSTGAPANPTPTGEFHVTWKARVHRSTVDTSWIMRWCVNIENREGMALHQYALPGRPASHCCVRLTEPDARWLFDWVLTWRLADDGIRVLERGTPVWIAGSYDHDAVPPWRRLPVDPGADRVATEEFEPPGVGVRD